MSEREGRLFQSNGDWQKKACRPEDLGELMDDKGVEYGQTSLFVCALVRVCFVCILALCKWLCAPVWRNEK